MPQLLKSEHCSKEPRAPQQIPTTAKTINKQETFMLRRESDEAAASRAQGSDAPELLYHAGPLQSQKGWAITATTPP